MKTLITSILALLMTTGSALKAQDEYLGLPGDNLNLYAVMNLFQESETLEQFERNLNDENSKINNLDLNGDKYVDYIMVADYPDGDVHNIVLQVYVKPDEKQDVAVFTVQKLRNGVQIQLIGDEALYGRNYIVEPIYDETPNPGYTGRRGNNRVSGRTTYYEVAAWPVVRYIYMPTYVVWRPDWHWGYYPVYWRAWNPYYYHYYYGYHHHYFPVYSMHYRHWSEPRWSGYHSHYYSGIRSHSPTVVVNINKGNYKTTYSRPESRREGETYAKNHPNRAATSVSSRRTTAGEGNRASSSRRTPSSDSRTGTVSAGSRRSASSGNDRAATSSGNRRNSNGSYNRQAPASERSSGAKEPERSSANANSSRRSSTSETYNRPASSGERRQPSVSSNRSSGSSAASRPAASSSSGSRRSSEASAPGRSSSRPQQSAGSSPRPSRESTARSSSGSRSRSNNNTNTAVKKDEASKDSERQSRR